MIIYGIIGISICIILFIYFKTVEIKFKYEIIEYNKVIILIKLYLFNKKVYDYKNKYTYENVIEIFAKKKYKKRNKVKKQIRNTKKVINTIIKDLTKEKIKISVYLGNTNIIFNCYLVAFISSVISMFLVNNIRIKNINNVKYKIIPIYNNNNIIFNGNIKCRIITILKIFVRLKLIR